MRDGTLWLRQFPRPETGCLAYLVGDRESGTAVVIDPGHDPAPYLRALSEGDWSLAGIVETHTHADHLAGHAALHAKTGAPIFVSRRSPAQYSHRSLSEGDSVPFGADAVGVLETPGHTRDHLTLRVRDKIFTGDTLLIGACGRTDLGDGSPEMLYESLTGKILRFPDTTEVYPAHFGRRHALPERYCSTVGFERATNEALNQADRATFLAVHDGRLAAEAGRLRPDRRGESPRVTDRVGRDPSGGPGSSGRRAGVSTGATPLCGLPATTVKKRPGSAPLRCTSAPPSPAPIPARRRSSPRRAISTAGGRARSRSRSGTLDDERDGRRPRGEARLRRVDRRATSGGPTSSVRSRRDGGGSRSGP